jgi:hypothetical protein
LLVPVLPVLVQALVLMVFGVAPVLLLALVVVLVSLLVLVLLLRVALTTFGVALAPLLVLMVFGLVMMMFLSLCTSAWNPAAAGRGRQWLQMILVMSLVQAATQICTP